MSSLQKQADQPVAFSFSLSVFQQLEEGRLSEFIVHT